MARRRVSKIKPAHYHHGPIQQIPLLDSMFVAVMSIEQAEVLKRELTDKWVVVDKTIPELKRFAAFTGKVKTVNMNGQALVEFDSGENIGWYDINPSFLKVVDGPQKKEQPAAKAEAALAKAAPKAAAGGKSPLEMARAQGAGAAAPAGAKPKPAGGASPLDMIRKQGAAKAEGAAAPAAEPGAKKLSPLDMIRKQGAAKGADAAAAPPAAKETSDTAEEPVAEAPVEKVPVEKAPAAKPAAASGEKLSPLDMIRKQGPAKK